MKKILLAFLALLAFSGPVSAAVTPPPEGTEYVVTRGDTLWGLSERFFKDPYYWPDLWAKNPAITNPHLIYPGQKLRFYKDRVETVAAVQTPPPSTTAGPDAGELSTAVPTDSTVKEKSFFVGGGETFVEKTDLPKAGEIVATFENRVMVGEGDYVYTNIGANRGGTVGQVYSVYQIAEPISHPVRNYIVGNRIHQIGTIKIVEVTPTSSKAQVLRSYFEISKDSFLVPYEPAKRVIPLRKGTRELKGYIVGTRKTNELIGEGEIVYLDLGRKQGLETGNLLYSTREIVPDTSGFATAGVTLPTQVLGAVVVIETREESATALVIKSVAPIFPGDRVQLTPEN